MFYVPERENSTGVTHSRIALMHPTLMDEIDQKLCRIHHIRLASRCLNRTSTGRIGSTNPFIVLEKMATIKSKRFVMA